MAILRRLDTDGIADEIRRRMKTLTAADRALWGSMSAAEMVCHLRDSYRLAVGALPETVPAVRGPIPPSGMRFLALSLPVRWPKNVPTVEAVRQGGGGQAPVEFASDRDDLLRMFDRFFACKDNVQRHPIFGPMRPRDWMRWGYLHANHHLRQFSR